MQQNDSAREKSGMGWDRLGLLQRAVAWYNYIKIINLEVRDEESVFN